MPVDITKFPVDPNTHQSTAVKIAVSFYGQPGDNVSGPNPPGSCGINVNSKLGGMGFAELEMGHALGGLKCGQEVFFNKVGGGPVVKATKFDIGLGGPGVQGVERCADLWFPVWTALGLDPSAGVSVIEVSLGPSSRDPNSGDIGAAVPIQDPLTAALAAFNQLGKIADMIVSAVKWVTNVHNLERIMYVLLGVVALYLALSQISPKVKAFNGKVKKVAVEAGTAAALA